MRLTVGHGEHQGNMGDLEDLAKVKLPPGIMGTCRPEAGGGGVQEALVVLATESIVWVI